MVGGGGGGGGDRPLGNTGRMQTGARVASGVWRAGASEPILSPSLERESAVSRSHTPSLIVYRVQTRECEMSALSSHLFDVDKSLSLRVVRVCATVTRALHRKWPSRKAQAEAQARLYSKL
eukprot:scaffold2667_cov72-Phaeocystis_antarctica.AAC.3